MNLLKSSRKRLATTALLVVGGLFAAVAIACGTAEPEVVTEIQTVVVERPVTQVEKVVETVVVEKVVEGETVKVIETVIVDRPVTRTETVIETVVVERVVEGQTVKVVETVLVEKQVTVTEQVVQTVVVEKPVVIEKEVTVTEKVVETVIVRQDVTIVATPTPAGMEPISGGTVRWALDNNVSTLDALKTTSQPEIGALHSQEKLFEFDENLTPQPSLVESWISSDDGLTWTFTLREGSHLQRARGRPPVHVGARNGQLEALACERQLRRGTQRIHRVHRNPRRPNVCGDPQRADRAAPGRIRPPRWLLAVHDAARDVRG